MKRVKNVTEHQPVDNVQENEGRGKQDSRHAILKISHLEQIKEREIGSTPGSMFNVRLGEKEPDKGKTLRPIHIFQDVKDLCI